MAERDLVIVRAVPADAPAIEALQHRSLRQLGRGFYSEAEIEALIRSGVFEPELIGRGTYHVARLDGRIVGCGGWSRGSPHPPGLKLAGAGGIEAGESGAEAVHIRALYVDPDHARCGIGRRLMARIEAEAAARGHDCAELVATLMGVHFYGGLGYRLDHRTRIILPCGTVLDAARMSKPLPAADALALSA